MYSGLLMTNSDLYKNYPYHQNKISDMNTLVRPRFAPIQSRFGENHYENFHVQPQNPINPAYQQQHVYENFDGQPHTPISDAYQDHPWHQTPNQGFSFQQGQLTNNAPLHPQGFPYQYSVPEQFRTDYWVSQQADYWVSQQAQAPQVQRNVSENPLVVELESPIFPNSKPRIRWTPELHERFTRAAQELGGYFKATPKAILQKMNVRGLTRDHLKSHLQKVRNSVLASEILNGQAYGMPHFESHIEENERLKRSCDIQNHQNHRIALINEDPAASNFKFNFEEDFGFSPISQTTNYQQCLRNAMCDDHAEDMNFKDSDFD